MWNCQGKCWQFVTLILVSSEICNAKLWWIALEEHWELLFHNGFSFSIILVTTVHWLSCFPSFAKINRVRSIVCFNFRKTFCVRRWNNKMKHFRRRSFWPFNGIQSFFLCKIPQQSWCRCTCDKKTPDVLVLFYKYPNHYSSSDAVIVTLRWRHNERDGFSNHQPHECLLKRSFRCRSKKTSKLRVTGLCAGNLPGTGELPAQRAR